jgi:hypothetical protein
MPLLTILALAAIAAGAWARERLLPGVPGADAWRAALGGMGAAGIAGALSNDSGPLLLVMATFGAAWVWGYLRSPPRSEGLRSTV